MTRKLAVLAIAAIACTIGFFVAQLAGRTLSSDEILRIIATVATVCGFGVLVYGMRRSARETGAD